eukprot:jgi/Mesvir1/17430/Mv08708-RA.2
MEEWLGLPLGVWKFMLCLLGSLPASYGLRKVEGRAGRNSYAFWSGALLCVMAFDFSSVLQLLLLSAVSYIIMKVWRSHCGIAVFVVSFTYLISCHWVYESASAWKSGRIDFTGSLMLLTLKLISLAFNYQDGANPAKESLQDVHVQHAVAEMPPLMEFLGYLFCGGSLLAGPVYQFDIYRAFINYEREYDRDQSRPMPQELTPALRSLGAALIFAVLHVLLGTYLPYSGLLADDFGARSLPARLGYIYVVGLTARFKYYFGWKTGEAGMKLSGLAFDGWTEERMPRPSWERGVNCRPWKVEFASSAATYPLNWNITTSDWLRYYVYLRPVPRHRTPTFLNLAMTQVVAGVWHGLYPGYLMFFVSSSLMIAASKSERRRVGTFTFRATHRRSRSHFLLVGWCSWPTKCGRVVCGVACCGHGQRRMLPFLPDTRPC